MCEPELRGCSQCGLNTQRAAKAAPEHQQCLPPAPLQAGAEGTAGTGLHGGDTAGLSLSVAMAEPRSRDETKRTVP